MTTLTEMEVHFPPELEAKLQEMVPETGRGTDDLLQDAFAGYFAEMAELREMLDTRYDEIKSGKVQSIDGEEVFAQLRRMSEDRRASLK